MVGNRARNKVLLVGAVWAAAVFPPRAGWSSEVSNAAGKLIELDGRIRNLAAEFKDEQAPQPNAAERRLIDAQTLIELGNFGEAATLLLDIVERYPDTRVYDDAVVLLGDCLFKERDYLAARRYFEKAIEKKTGTRREQQALQRLIEIALKTNNFDGVDAYLDRLGDIPPSALEPSVPYVRGKYLFFRDRLDDAQTAFAQIDASNPYHLQARYFIATVLTKKGDLAGASAGFDGVLKIQPRNDADKEVQDLARLALGRLFYERSQFDKAKDMYVSIDRRSKHFGDALFESAWTSIKASDFKAAYRAFDLMLLAEPDSPRAPELRLLMGNLNLRLGKFFEASDAFSSSRDQFEPIHKELLATTEKAKADPKYFETLLGSELDKFDITVFIPPAAAKWVKDEPEVARVVGLAAEVGDVKKGISDAEQLLQRLDRAVNGGGKVGIFPDLADKREQSSEVLNQTLDIRRKFAARARKLAEPYLSPDDRTALNNIEAERARLEDQLKELPLTTEALRARDKGTKGELQGLDGQASEVNVLTHSLEAELVALEQFYRNSPEAKKIPPAELEAEIRQLRDMLVEIKKQNDQVRDQIADAARQNTAAGSAGEGERSAVKRLSDLITAEHEMYRKARARMSGSEQGQFDGISGVLERAATLQQQVAEFDARVDSAAEGRLVKIREQIETERQSLIAVAGQLTTLTSESQGVGGGLAGTIVSRVSDRFYELVVQSDVGIIDVTWGIKDSKTQNLSKLVTAQKNEMKALDEDLGAILKEDEQDAEPQAGAAGARR